ncbi:MAG: VOC family protein [Actinobacteria bacterium]|nr:VOC family protein [Actinomycetota bacterium]
MTDSGFPANTLRTFLWFGGRLGEALEFYKETFGHVVIHGQDTSPDGTLFTADFSIYGHEFIGLNWPGGPEFNEAISLSISCDGQEETDRLWDALTKDGKPGNCGWCTDPFGVTWQVTPKQLRDHLGNPDPEKAAYAMAALRDMGKIVIADLYE